MQRRPKMFLFIGIVLPMLIGLSLFPIFNAPQAILLFNYSLFIYPAIVICFLFFVRKKTIVKNHIQNKSLTSTTWLAKIISIQLITTSLFSGQFFTYGQYEIQTQQLTKAQLNPWFLHLLFSFFSGWNIALWAFVLVALLVFYYARNKFDSPHALTDLLPFPKNATGRLLRVVADNYIAQSTRLLICFSAVIASLQISLFIYPAYNPMLNALFGIVLTGITFFISTTAIMQRIFKTLKEKKLPPVMLFLLFLLFNTLILFLMSLMMTKIHVRTEHILAVWHNLMIFPASERLMLDKVTMIAWWIMATPLLASLLFMLSHQRTLKVIMSTVMFFPLVCSLLAWLIHTQSQTIHITHATIFVTQMIGLLGLLILLSHRSAHRILWFGYFTDAKLKKLRVIPPRIFWQLMACFVGLFAVSGIQIFYIIYTILALGISLIYLLLLGSPFNTKYCKSGR
jgi:hypothetical protein